MCSTGMFFEIEISALGVGGYRCDIPDLSGADVQRDNVDLCSRLWALLAGNQKVPDGRNTSRQSGAKNRLLFAIEFGDV